jgi:hypothetical protein
MQPPIQDILDFKAWVCGCLKDGLETLVRHINMHLFRFFVNSFGCLMIQYKISPINSIWSPMEGLPIQLWKVNPNGSPKLPIGVPNLVPYRPI